MQLGPDLRGGGRPPTKPFIWYFSLMIDAYKLLRDYDFTRMTRNVLILSGGRGLRYGWLRPGWL